MRELIYTLLELVRESKKTCDFCSNPYGKDNESAFRIVTRIKLNNEWLADDVVCEDCKEKFENDELTKCERCGRLQTKLDIDFSSGKYICDCIRYNEDLEEKELPSVPYESQAVFYERQINKLQEEKMLAENTIEEEREAHEDFMRVSEEWSKRQKEELLEENKKLKEREKKMTVGELIDKMEFIEKEITELKAQLAQLTTTQQQTAQIETPAKENKLKNLFKFGSK